MKTRIQNVFFALALLALSIFNSQLITARAQGTAFTYQGRLNNGSNPASGSYDLMFSLFTTNASGVAIAGPVTNGITAVTNGLFTTTIDFGAGVFTGTSNWLEIAVRTNGSTTFSTLAPRQQVTPTPYAITAENVNGLTIQPNAASGAPNFIGGSSANFVAPGIIGATIAGGGEPVSGTQPATNTVAANFGSIGGGFENIIQASAVNATIAGGENNQIQSTARFSTIGGGAGNLIQPNAIDATIGGGGGNTVNGNYGTVPGGSHNTATNYSFATGQNAQALNTGTFVWADDSTATPFASTGLNQFLIQAKGGVGINTNNPNGAALNVNGTVIAASFVGSGAGLTGVNLGLNSAGSISPAGTFLLSQSFSLDFAISSVAIADVNGDGLMDVISSTGDVFTNNGSGGLGYSSYRGINAGWVIAADVNGDGKVDLVEISGNVLTVITNDGVGGFVTATTFAVGSQGGLASAVAVDVNGDQKVDLVCANSADNMVTVLTNAGSGNFGISGVYPTGNASGQFLNSPTIVAADFNGDGKLDFARLDDSTITVMTNDGSGHFALLTTVPTYAGGSSIAAADVNGDGKTDLIYNAYHVAGDNVEVNVLTNNGSGGFAPAGTYFQNNLQGPIYVTVADVNGDGRPDLITADYSDSVMTVLTNNGYGAFKFSPNIQAGGGQAMVATGDLNGDGRIDLVCVVNDVLEVFMNVATYSGNFSGNGAALTQLSADAITGGLTADLDVLVPGPKTNTLHFVNGILRTIQ